MRKRSWGSWFAMAVVLAVSAAPATHAELINATVTGPVALYLPSGELPQTIESFETYTLRFTFDNATPASSHPDDYTALYPAIQSAILVVGDQVATGGGGTIKLVNGISQDLVWISDIHLTGAMGQNGVTDFVFGGQLSSQDGTIFYTEGLGGAQIAHFVSAPMLASTVLADAFPAVTTPKVFPTQLFFPVSANPGFGIFSSASLSSVVPEPESAALVALALGAVATVARRSRLWHGREVRFQNWK